MTMITHPAGTATLVAPVATYGASTEWIVTLNPGMRHEVRSVYRTAQEAAEHVAYHIAAGHPVRCHQEHA